MNERLSDYNVVWETPSENETGSMPLGNGDLGLNVWVEPGGDVLLLIGKTDAWDENSINLKLGRIRLKLTPSPLVDGLSFRQTLRLRTGEIEIVLRLVRIRIWVDANHNLIRFAAESESDFQLQASLEMWRTVPRTIKTQTSDLFKNLVGKNSDPYPTIVWPDHNLGVADDRIVWCHHDEGRDPDPYEINMRLQGLGEMMDRMPHPLKGRTFGAAMEGEGFRREGECALISKRARQSHLLNIHALTLPSSTTDTWRDALDRQIDDLRRIDLIAARKDHQRWWDAFWNRSWIYVTADSPAEAPAVFSVTQSYLLQRFMNAAAGRAGPIKHNGSIFSVGRPDDPDFRRWGGPGFWFQNQRLIYWPMLASGDFDLMAPWFGVYRDSLELQQFRTAKYFQHTGAHYPETITFWGAEISAHYGWTPFEQRKRPEAECAYLTYYWTGGVELTLMLIEYFTHTRDVEFAREVLIPIGTSVLEFFDLHYARDEKGKVRFEPAQALETWHVAVNPLPEIAGLRYTLSRMLELPETLTTAAQRQRWQRMIDELPNIPTGEKDGHRMILPAERFDVKKITENPELYCVFPYRLFGLRKPDLQLARDTFEARLIRLHECWSQDDIQMALLGLTQQVKEWIVARASPASHSDSRFPGFWNAFHDWVPDVDHGGVLQMALQLMLMQVDGERIVLLPACPKEWNADFKLHAPGQIVVQGVVRGGKVVELNVTPETARKQVEL